MAARHFGKYFEIAEAERWLPRLRRIFARLHEVLDELGPDLHQLRHSIEHRGNGGGVDLHRYRAADETLSKLLSEIQDAGIVIQDVRRGLVDFPHWLDDREVFLCWELSDEDRIGWYHEIRAGFAGRRPLPR